MHWLDALGDIAAIFTAGVALWAYIKFRCDQAKKQKKLEEYLKARKKNNQDYQHSLLHLMARLGMTESELLSASFNSSHINRLLAQNDSTGRAEAILLEYAD